MKCPQRTMSPLGFAASSFCSLSTSSTLSSSIPFPIDDKPVRQYKSSSQHPMDIDDPSMYQPKSNGIHLDFIFQQSICSGWLTKHKKRAFSFMRSEKKRYVILVDRILYSFKSETPNTYREYFEITKDTHAYLTDQIPGVPYCIEIGKARKSDTSDVWYLQVKDTETMKVWLSYIKRVIAWLRADNGGAITKEGLDKIVTEAEEYSQFSLKKRSRTNTNDSSLNELPFRLSTQPSLVSLSSIDTSFSDKANPRSRMDSTFTLTRTGTNNSSVIGLPPQPPPPKSLPPPIPFS